jgi:hypothetical protein
MLVLHRDRSWPRFLLPMLLSLILVTPSVRFYYWIIEQELHSLPSPTRDKPIVEGIQELGGGFRRVALAEYVERGFEGVYHGEYLFYRDRKLAHFSSASVSPSRHFAAYLHLGSGKVVLFRAADQTVIEFSGGPVEDFAGFDWDEGNQKVTLRFSTARPAQDFPLQR